MRLAMQANREKGIWKRVKGKIKWVLDELKEDSVAQNPTKPIDCCNPPVPEKKERKKELRISN